MGPPYPRGGYPLPERRVLLARMPGLHLPGGAVELWSCGAVLAAFNSRCPALCLCRFRTSTALPVVSVCPSLDQTCSRVCPMSDSLVDPFFRLQVSTLALSRDLTRKREGVTAPGCSLPGQRLFCPLSRHTRGSRGALSPPSPGSRADAGAADAASGVATARPPRPPRGPQSSCPSLPARS